MEYWGSSASIQRSFPSHTIFGVNAALFVPHHSITPFPRPTHFTSTLSFALSSVVPSLRASAESALL